MIEKMSGADLGRLESLAAEAASRAREEAERICKALGLPTELVVHVPRVIIEGPAAAKWEHAPQRINALKMRRSWYAIQDAHVEWKLDGLHEFATALVEEFGEKLAWGHAGFGASLRYQDRERVPRAYDDDPVEWVSTFIAEPMVREYLAQLENLSVDGPRLAKSLVGELIRVASSVGLPQRARIAIAGVDLGGDPMVASGPITIRKLTPEEVGVLGRVPQRLAFHVTEFGDGGAAFDGLQWPTHVLTVDFERDRRRDDGGAGENAMLQRVATALGLLGAKLTCVSPIATIQTDPHWLSEGTIGTAPLAIARTRHQSGDPPLSVDASVLDRARSLAEKIPASSWRQPRTVRDVIFHRYMQGTTRESAYDQIVDFVVALEASLVGSTVELSHRFALYGAMFIGSSADDRLSLRDDFAWLYKLRSSFAHGSKFPLQADIRRGAELSRGLCQRVLLKCLEDEWPVPDELDSQLLT